MQRRSVHTMSHVDKNERRRQNGQDNNGNIFGNASTHKARGERYRNNYSNTKKNISPKVRKTMPKYVLINSSIYLCRDFRIKK